MKELSNREKEVIKHLEDGLSVKKIGEEMSLMRSTVSTYVKRIKEKLNLPLDTNTYLVVKTYWEEEYKKQTELVND